MPNTKWAAENGQLAGLSARSSASLAALVDSTENPFWSVDPGGRLVAFNKAASAYLYRALGVSAAPGLPAYDTTRPDQAALWPGWFARALEEGPFRAEQNLPDGSWLELSFRPVLDDSGDIRVVIIGADISRLKRAVDELRTSRTLLEETESLAQAGSSTWDIATDTTVWSEGLYRITGRDPAAPAPSQAERSQLYTPESWIRLEAAARRALASGEPYDLEVEIVRPDRSLRTARARGAAIHDAQGRVTKLFGTLQDITEQKRLEAKLFTHIRDLQLLSAINSARLRARTEQDLLTEYCRIIVQVGGYRMAWVGFAQDKPGKPVLPVAHFGFEEGYLEQINVSWSDVEIGRGSTGRSIRTGMVQVTRDFNTDPRAKPWRDEALQRGYQSSISLPFRLSDGTMACLTTYGVTASAWTEAERRLMEQIALDLGFGINTLRNEIAKNHYQDDLRVSLEQTIQVIAETVDQRDPFTAGHQRRVADLCTRIGGYLELTEDRIHGLHLGASIHDLGKIAIPLELLAKPGRLSPAQFEIIKEHVELGYQIIKDVRFPWPVGDIILQHHERLDGSGYPRKLTAESIVLEARIVAVADVVEAMSSHRPYRVAPGIERALEEIEANSGRLYDSSVVEACVYLFREQGYKFPD